MEEKKRGRPKKIQTKTSSFVNEEKWYEIFALQDFITQYSAGASLTDISLKDLYTYLKNPYKYVKYIRNAAKYLANKHGIVKDVNYAFAHLPTLNYHLVWSSFDDPKKIKRYEQKVYDFLNKINVKKLVRDGLYEEAEAGTVVVVFRNGKYAQFLDLDDLRINKQVNGKWVIEYDLKSLSQIKNTNDLLAQIESLPDEITVGAYNLYKNKGEDYRFVEIKNAYVLKIRGNRNFPWGLPYCVPAFASLIQKSLVDKVEKYQVNKLIKNILILYAKLLNEKDGSGKRPSKELVTAYFNEIKNLLKKEDSATWNESDKEVSGVGVLALPDFLELKPLPVDMKVFTEELYEKIRTDILQDLGVSSSLIFGGGEDTSYSSAVLNGEKIFTYIFGALEDWEEVINDQISKLLPQDLSAKFFFDRTTIFNKDKQIAATKDLYLAGGPWAPYAELVLNIPYHYILGMKEYEKKVLNLDEIIVPPKNYYTQSNKGGRPQGDKPQDDGGASNLNPSPSD